MLKVLVKKQLLEINRALFVDRKTGKGKSRKSIILAIVGFSVLMLFLAVMFFFMSASMIIAFSSGGMRWLYFTIIGTVAVLLGVFGSVFNTFSSLYQAKDNDFLLSLPIPSRYIMFTRLIGVYIMGTLYSGIVFIPAMIAYYVFGSPTVFGVIGSVVLAVLVSVFVLTLSCVLGWIVAKISSKLKNKSFITVIISVAFFAAYYFFVSRSADVIEGIISSGEEVAANLKLYAYPLYAFGMAGEGDMLSLLIISAIVLGLFALVYFILSHSFLKIVTATTGVKRTAYKSDGVKARGYKSALFNRELKRFTSSATYMLNCGFGILVLLFMAIAVFFIPSELTNAMISNGFAKYGSVLAFAAVSVIAATVDITAPSVSLEGKNLWIIKTLPVEPKDVLKAKLKLHFFLVAPLAFICSVCASIVFANSVLSAALAVVDSVVFVFLTACFGLVLNLKMPDLNWTVESAPVKQSLCSFIAMFGMIIAALLLAGAAFALTLVLPDFVGLIIVLALVCGAVALLYSYIINRGVEIFSRL